MEGGKLDKEKAFEWYKRAAEQGNVYAGFQLPRFSIYSDFGNV